MWIIPIAHIYIKVTGAYIKVTAHIMELISCMLQVYAKINWFYAKNLWFSSDYIFHPVTPLTFAHCPWCVLYSVFYQSWDFNPAEGLLNSITGWQWHHCITWNVIYTCLKSNCNTQSLHHSEPLNSISMIVCSAMHRLNIILAHCFLSSCNTIITIT